jgi:hypothetical protein
VEAKGVEAAVMVKTEGAMVAEALEVVETVTEGTVVGK